MSILWTSEKISQLSLEEVKQLSENAKSKNAEVIVSLCQAEILSRKTKPISSINLPEGFERVARSAIVRSLERDAVELLVQLAKKLENKYDLSAEKARYLSEGTKRFQPHRLLNSRGSAKVGGAQRLGVVCFDRYISYRLKDDLYALVALLSCDDGVSGVQYQVIGPKEVLKNSRPISELRSYLPKGATIGFTRHGEEFDNFDEASRRFILLIEQVAPKHKVLEKPN